MTHSTGGIIGMGSQKSTTTVVVQQNCLLPGEKIKVTIDYDGRKCDKKVKSFKFKLFRLITNRDVMTGKHTTKITKIFAFKEPGADEKKLVKRDFSLLLPPIVMDEKTHGKSE